MKQTRESRIQQIEGALGDRRLIWFGIRGNDAAPLLRLRQFRDCFSVIAPLGALSLESDDTLESFSGVRVDLDMYDIDLDRSEEVTRLRRMMLRRFREWSAVATYRPSHFLSDAAFAAHRTCHPLALFKDRHLPYEYKPWVETELRRYGVATIPWWYVADESRDQVRAALDEGPLVLRPSRTSGGQGIVVVDDADQIDSVWPGAEDRLVAVAPFLQEALPINVGGVVYSDGSIRLHPASVQLIGIADATSKVFGYCGNDFARFTELDRPLVMAVDAAARLVGDWLRVEGYRGAFGVDFLVHEGAPLFAEVNPRLQGSTSLSTRLSETIGQSDVVLEHLAAFLGLPPPSDLNLWDWRSELPGASHLVVHNCSAGDEIRTAEGSDLLTATDLGVEFQLLPDAGIRVAPGATLARLLFARSITSSGFEIDGDACSAAKGLHREFQACG